MTSAAPAPGARVAVSAFPAREIPLWNRAAPG